MSILFIFQKIDGFNSNIPGGQSKGFDFPNENSGNEIGTTEYSNTNYRNRYTYFLSISSTRQLFKFIKITRRYLIRLNHTPC